MLPREVNKQIYSELVIASLPPFCSPDPDSYQDW